MSDYRGTGPTTAFLKTFRRLLRDQAFRVATTFLAVMIATGTFVYTIVEEWSLLDSLYFAVIAASTVGFGDLAPVTDVGKIYTIVYVLVTTGLDVLLYRPPPRFATLLSKMQRVIVNEPRITAKPPP